MRCRRSSVLKEICASLRVEIALRRYSTRLWLCEWWSSSPCSSTWIASAAVPPVPGSVTPFCCVCAMLICTCQYVRLFACLACCLFVYVCMPCWLAGSLSISLSVCMPVCLSLSLSPSLFLPLSLSDCVSYCLLVCLSISMHVWLSFPLYAHMSDYLSISMSPCLCISV